MISLMFQVCAKVTRDKVTVLGVRSPDSDINISRSTARYDRTHLLLFVAHNSRSPKRWLVCIMKIYVSSFIDLALLKPHGTIGRRLYVESLSLA